LRSTLSLKIRAAIRRTLVTKEPTAMDRMERTVRHGKYRIIATAAKTLERGPGRAEWDVLVSVWKLGNGVDAVDPVMLRLGDRRWSDPALAIREAVDVAKQRIDADNVNHAT